ncbi:MULTISPECIES: GDSL-type esterase/lipase family protein [Nesterenkonia]|uniref:Anti-anti-sigma regulatory factor n=1 Tax=Nesterenkonia xinjiangensis TaxID=225327 RepID=A0A7Z0GNL7_9MICC|nr:GDSL-type esterase/lipase family protein [Nesterenkonia sp. HG001]MDZ5076019.1 GDSL-type esterase/lipase family protein [Nesterenkonia sp. HG001]NYJ79210.1 anti-anti-sigma regulatory factor [Nesterenkonia xinjiangensis]
MDRSIRIVAVGNELLTGAGDPRALGWLGRVLAKTPTESVQLEPYVLAMPGEGTEALSHRWQAEAAPRFGEDTENHLIVALNDIDLDSTTSSARSRLNLANILDRASQEGIRCLVVGPPPGLDPERNQRLAELNTAYQDVASRRSHVYVDTLTPLVQHEQWRHDLAANDGVPGQAGYGLIAWLVLHRGWYQWLGLREPAA